MSNLISHAKQGTIINLDNVSSIYHDAGKSKEIHFTMTAMNDDERMDEGWYFSTEKEAGQVYDKIIGTFALVL